MQESKVHSPSSVGPWWAVMGLWLVALVLRWPQMSASVWIDELYTSSLFCGPPLVLLKTLFSDIHPPAYFVFMHGWVALFGDGEWSLRLPALIAGLLSLLLVLRLGTVWFGPRAGWLAAWGLALSPTHIWYSTEARPYSANLLLALLCVWTYTHLRERSGGWRLVGWAALLTVTAWSHYYLAALPFGILLWELGERGARWKGRSAAAGMALLMAIGLVAFKAFASEVPTEKSYLRTFGLAEWWQLFFVWFPTGEVLAPRSALPGEFWGAGWHRLLPFLWAGLFLLGAVAGWRRNPKAAIWTLAWAVAIPLGLWVLGAAGLSKAYIERSALPSMPFVYLLMGAGLAAGTQRWRLARIGGSVALAGLCALLLVAFYQRADHWTVYKPKPDWRAATEFLQGALPPSGPPLSVYSDYPSPTALTYYDARIQESKNFAFNGAKWAKAEERLGGLPLVGSLLREQVMEWRVDWQARMDRLQDETRALVHELRYVAPDLSEPCETPVWLVVYGKPQAAAQALLADPRIEIGQTLHPEGLTLYALRW